MARSALWVAGMDGDSAVQSAGAGDENGPHDDNLAH